MNEYEFLRKLREIDSAEGTYATVNWLKIAWNNRYVLMGLIALVMILIAWF